VAENWGGKLQYRFAGGEGLQNSLDEEKARKKNVDMAAEFGAVASPGEGGKSTGSRFPKIRKIRQTQAQASDVPAREGKRKEDTRH